MEFLCASCSRRLEYALRRGLGLKTMTRMFHLSTILPEVIRPKLKEDELADGAEVEDVKVSMYETKRLVDPDLEAIRKHYHDNLPSERKVDEEWREMRCTWKELPGVYLNLSKSRLTALVVLTALAGYSMAPAPFDLSTLLWTTSGTALCSAAANSFNQWIEVPFDSQMARTRNRVLVRGRISSLHAALFGLASATSGVLLLYHTVNPLTAYLGLSTILLYCTIYTPLKRISIINTWVGSVVGAIPPLMGWAACTGSLSLGGLVLPSILFAWQFAHFNALSWGHRGDYSRAGYRMMAVTDPELCKRVALRYSLATIPICALAPVFDLTTWFFAFDSLPVNLWLVYLSWRFYRDSDFKSARKLFQYSLLHLPVLMALVFINKKLWHTRKIIPSVN